MSAGVTKREGAGSLEPVPLPLQSSSSPVAATSSRFVRSKKPSNWFTTDKTTILSSLSHNNLPRNRPVLSNNKEPVTSITGNSDFPSTAADALVVPVGVTTKSLRTLVHKQSFPSFAMKAFGRVTRPAIDRDGAAGGNGAADVLSEAELMSWRRAAKDADIEVMTGPGGVERRRLRARRDGDVLLADENEYEGGGAGGEQDKARSLGPTTIAPLTSSSPSKITAASTPSEPPVPPIDPIYLCSSIPPSVDPVTTPPLQPEHSAGTQDPSQRTSDMPKGPASMQKLYSPGKSETQDMLEHATAAQRYLAGEAPSTSPEKSRSGIRLQTSPSRSKRRSMSLTMMTTNLKAGNQRSGSSTRPMMFEVWKSTTTTTSSESNSPAGGQPQAPASPFVDGDDPFASNAFSELIRSQSESQGPGSEGGLSPFTRGSGRTLMSTLSSTLSSSSSSSSSPQTLSSSKSQRRMISPEAWKDVSISASVYAANRSRSGVAAAGSSPSSYSALLQVRSSRAGVGATITSKVVFPSPSSSRSLTSSTPSTTLAASSTFPSINGYGKGQSGDGTGTVGVRSAAAPIVFASRTTPPMGPAEGRAKKKGKELASSSFSSSTSISSLSSSSTASSLRTSNSKPYKNSADVNGNWNENKYKNKNKNRSPTPLSLVNERHQWIRDRSGGRVESLSPTSFSESSTATTTSNSSFMTASSTSSGSTATTMTTSRSRATVPSSTKAALVRVDRERDALDTLLPSQEQDKDGEDGDDTLLMTRTSTRVGSRTVRTARSSPDLKKRSHFQDVGLGEGTSAGLSSSSGTSVGGLVSSSPTGGRERRKSFSTEESPEQVAARRLRVRHKASLAMLRQERPFFSQRPRCTV